ncbi:hypothetical protein DA097_08350 [Vibrio rotiferianus]|nr:hypothetical protein DA097_08350 [Vibrio rotiferianus]
MGSYASKDDIHCHRICISHTDMVWLFLFCCVLKVVFVFSFVPNALWHACQIPTPIHRLCAMVLASGSSVLT